MSAYRVDPSRESLSFASHEGVMAVYLLQSAPLPEGAYLADVGFGNLAPTSALLLAPQIEQETPHELMRFIDVGGELTLQARLKHGWQHIYRVIPYPRYDSEYEITNWYTGTHPETPYQSNIIAAKPGPNRTRITMYNARVTVRDADGQAGWPPRANSETSCGANSN